jgi:hypothetical protein
MPTLFLGFGHYSRTGKDTTANYFLSHYGDGVLKRSFAWKLKQITYELYAWAGLMPPEYYETPEGAKARDIKLPGLDMTPVEVWVAFGTEAIRKNVYQGTWVDYLLKNDHKCDVLVIPDVRFPNEAEAIKTAGGKIVKVVRPGYGPRNTVADRALIGYDGWDYVIGESGEMDDLDNWACLFAMAARREIAWPRQTAEERKAALTVERIEQ